MEYTFHYFIEDENDNVVVRGTTYISQHIGEFGECESVDMEIGSAMRYFKKRRQLDREREEEQRLQDEEDAKDDENLCGKAHNNGAETCMECDIIRAGV